MKQIYLQGKEEAQMPARNWRPCRRPGPPPTFALRPGTVLGAKRWHLHLAELVSHRQVM